MGETSNVPIKLPLFLIMFSTGLASLLYEVVLISVITTVVGATELALSIVLASFLFGIAAGALIGGWFVNKKYPLLKILIIIELLVAVFGFSFLSTLSWWVSTGLPTHFVFWSITASLLIPTLLMGIEIPVAVGILEGYQKKSATGFIYFSDTLGGVIGALFTGLLFIPLLGFHGTMFLGAILNVFTAFIATQLKKKICENVYCAF